MPRHFPFVVKTSQHEWWIGADTEAIREEWVDALLNAGATLTGLAAAADVGDGGSVVGGSFADSEDLLTSAEGVVPAGSVTPFPHSPPPPGEDGELVGTLWKRPSKVHIAHDLENEPSWVARHFVLLPNERMLVYVQEKGDELDSPQVRPSSPISVVRPADPALAPSSRAPRAIPPVRLLTQGIVPLLHFAGIEEVDMPDGRAGFRLSSGRGARSSDDVTHADHDAMEPVTFLAESAEKRRQWVLSLAPLLQAPPNLRQGQGPRSTSPVAQSGPQS